MLHCWDRRRAPEEAAVVSFRSTLGQRLQEQEVPIEAAAPIRTLRLQWRLRRETMRTTRRMRGWPLLASCAASHDRPAAILARSTCIKRTYRSCVGMETREPKRHCPFFAARQDYGDVAANSARPLILTGVICGRAVIGMPWKY